VIASDGKYTLRGPRVFYDVRNDKALILDAVFSTFDTSRGFPLYVRARSVRQISEDEFIADHARISNTAFARPNLTIGARTVTIQRETVRQPDGSELPRTIADARNITLNAFGLPIGYLPRFHGDPENIALRDIRFVTSTENGAEVRTRWDLFSLLGISAPEGLSVNLLADALFERGAALGTQTTWAGEQFRGSLFSYWVLNDVGTDVLTSGAKIKREGEYRGLVRAEHIAKVGRDWTVFAELAHVTDENVVDAFFEDLAETGREFKSRVLARRLDTNSSLTLEASGQFDEFTPNEYLLQADGYSVQRLPEATYTRLSDDLLADVAPGILTYSSQTRIGNLSLKFTDRTPAEYGLRSNAKAQTGLGINANTTIADSLRSRGFREENIFRLDSRHELTADLGAGPFDITPWVVGRATVYDSDFDAFSSADNSERLWGAAGITLATTIQRVNNEIYSRPLDINRVRHIIRPSFTAFYADGTVDQQDLPTYDESVESLANGTVLRFGLDQTWQTQRGGPGRWYSVDWITLDAEAVFASDDTLRESPIGRYDESRPELSHLGNFGDITGTIQVTDALAIVGTSIYDFDRHQQVASSAGLVLEHSPTLNSSLRYRYLNDQDSTLISGSSRYTLTDKYSVSSNITYDTDLGDIQSIRGELVRDFQAAVFGVNFNYNNINGQTSFGVLFQPLGRGSASKIDTSSRSAINRGTGRFGS
ncbi:MAG TPA: LPS-assembly protein LptD, partial [Phycisphaerales bacterium]|nr:LPS-assembly protein LptD [Phycisphaerales bacterium]